jgi:hypothetical protein
MKDNERQGRASFKVSQMDLASVCTRDMAGRLAGWKGRGSDETRKSITIHRFF